jgi:DIS3-like exonuclease 2
MDNVDHNSSSGTSTGSKVAQVVSETYEEFSGIIRINPRCYTDAFIDDPQGGPDIFIEGMRSRNTALEGDLVLVRLNPQSEWKTNPMKNNVVQKTGSVVRIIKRNHPGVAGGYLKKFSETHALFSPIDSKVPRMLIDLRQCPPDFTSQPDRYKDVLFVAQMEHWNAKSKMAFGSIVKVVGDSNMIESRMEILLIENQIYDIDFPTEAYKELEYLDNLPANWFKKASKNRRNLTNECVFTIDPKTARDLDDAVSIKQIAEQIYEVGVHIADVSYFVREMTSVDYCARARTTSVYLVNRVIPMLPRPLCEHMCSLNPDEPKLTFSVIWKMDKYGRIIDEWFGKTIIKSCVKLSYEQAQDLIDHPDDISWIEEDVNMPRLKSFNWGRISRAVVSLNRIAQNMRTKRFSDGALRIDNVKIKYELDQESGLPTGFSFETRTDANYLIEEFMLQANMSVAKKIYKYSNEFAFLRRHPPSHPQVLKEVKEFCDAKGFPMDISSAGSIQKSINAISDRTTSRVVSYLLLRAMKNAEYICTGALPPNDSNYNHFALNVPFYTHFTSPIRRYADVIVHRQLALALGIEHECNEDVKTLGLMAAECTKRKISSKLISEASQKLYFNMFVQRAGFCELLACVTRIYDQCFEVILVDYNQTGRVYLDRIEKQLGDYKFENVDGIKRLVLNWKLPSKRAQKKAQKFKKLIEKHQSNSRDDFIDEKLNCRKDLEEPRQTTKGKLKINEIDANRRQIIQVFDVIRVVVTVDEKDISKLKIDLKIPD